MTTVPLWALRQINCLNNEPWVRFRTASPSKGRRYLAANGLPAAPLIAPTPSGSPRYETVSKKPCRQSPGQGFFMLRRAACLFFSSWARSSGPFLCQSLGHGHRRRPSGLEVHGRQFPALLLNVEADLLSFVEAPQSGALDCADMDEHILRAANRAAAHSDVAVRANRMAIVKGWGAWLPGHTDPRRLFAKVARSARTGVQSDANRSSVFWSPRQYGTSPRYHRSPRGWPARQQ